MKETAFVCSDWMAMPDGNCECGHPPTKHVRVGDKIACDQCNAYGGVRLCSVCATKAAPGTFVVGSPLPCPACHAKDARIAELERELEAARSQHDMERRDARAELDRLRSDLVNACDVKRRAERELRAVLARLVSRAEVEALRAVVEASRGVCTVRINFTDCCPICEEFPDRCDRSDPSAEPCAGRTLRATLARLDAETRRT